MIKKVKENSLKNISQLLIGIFILGTLVACARIGQPPGGPKDEDPPVAIKTKPVNYSTDYKRKSVLIKFDEFVTLKNTYTEFTISPPLEKAPIPRIKGKGVLVDLSASDLDSATYTMDFGQSISDLNEANPLPNFQFVVSKQAHIDSFSVSGKVLDAFNHQPDEERMFVYLQSNLADSTPYTVIPSYLGKTSPEGDFSINHVAPGIYNVFVLKDANANMIYDMPSEIIGFVTEPVHLNPDTFLVIKALEELEKLHILDSIKIYNDSIRMLQDTIVNDTLIPGGVISFSTTGDNINLENTHSHLHNENDSIHNDSVQTDSIEFMLYGFNIEIFSFEEFVPDRLYLSEYDRLSQEKLQIVFNGKRDSLPKLELLNPDTIGNWYLLEKNARLDTLVYWLPDSNLIKHDSIVIAVTHTATDTTDQLVWITDTLAFRFKSKIEEKKEKDGKRKRGFNLSFGNKEKKVAVDTLPVKPPRVPFKNNINSSAHDTYRSIIITPEAPVFEYNPELFELFRMVDTIEVATGFNFNIDSSNFRKSVIDIEFEPFTTYILKMHEGAFTDIFGRTIDSTKIKFITQKDDHYGVIEVNMTNIFCPTILQLIDAKDETVLKYAILTSDKLVSFDYLEPGSYKLKVIFDDNNNGKWDTGDLKLKRQPEKIDYFPQDLDVRSNWTIDYEWNMQE